MKKNEVIIYNPIKILKELAKEAEAIEKQQRKKKRPQETK